MMSVLLVLLAASILALTIAEDTAVIVNPDFENFAMEVSPGQWTDWFDFDPVTPYSLGEFEGVLAITLEEWRNGTCILPCETYAQYEVRFKEGLNGARAQYVVEKCLDYQDSSVMRREGFVCVNQVQKKIFNSHNTYLQGLGRCDETNLSKNWDDHECSLALPPNCNCPDVEVRYFCLGSPKELQDYCDRRTEEIQQSSTRKRRSLRHRIRDRETMEKKMNDYYTKK